MNEQQIDEWYFGEGQQQLRCQYSLSENAQPCAQVGCKHCPHQPSIWDQPPRGGIPEGSYVDEYHINSTGTLDPEDIELFMPDNVQPSADNVMHPNHYARWKMQPIQFIAINDLPWWLTNVIKYTMRYDAKDGLQDLYKARSYLEMKIRQLEGVERFWDKPVDAERKLNEISRNPA